MRHEHAEGRRHRQLIGSAGSNPVGRFGDDVSCWRPETYKRKSCGGSQPPILADLVFFHATHGHKRRLKPNRPFLHPVRSDPAQGHYLFPGSPLGNWEPSIACQGQLSSSSWLEQLDGVAVGIEYLNLLPTRPRDDVGAEPARRGSSGHQPSSRGPLPPAPTGSTRQAPDAARPTTAARLNSRPRWAADRGCYTSRLRRPHLLMLRSKPSRVERDRSPDVSRLVAEAVHPEREAT